MIALLRGEVRHGCVLTTTGVGYHVETAEPLVEGDHVELLVAEVYGRDGEPRRFGFTTPAQRETFSRLCKLPSVGPSASLALLRQLTPELIAAAVRDKDTDALEAARGVGHKAAELIVSRLDLGDVVDPGDPGAPSNPASPDDELVEYM